MTISLGARVVYMNRLWPSEGIESVDDLESREM